MLFTCPLAAILKDISPLPLSELKVTFGLSTPSGSRKFWFSHITTYKHTEPGSWSEAGQERVTSLAVRTHPLRPVVDAEGNPSCGQRSGGVVCELVHGEARQLACDFKHVELRAEAGGTE